MLIKVSENLGAKSLTTAMLITLGSDCIFDPTFGLCILRSVPYQKSHRSRVQMFELRLPVNGEMMKIASLRPVHTVGQGFPFQELPGRFFDVGPIFAKGGELQKSLEALPVEMACDNPDEVYTLAAGTYWPVSS